jgi:hypothetical protein
MSSSRTGGGGKPRKGNVDAALEGDWDRKYNVGEGGDLEMSGTEKFFGVGGGGEEAGELEKSEENEVER